MGSENRDTNSPSNLITLPNRMPSHLAVSLTRARFGKLATWPGTAYAGAWRYSTEYGKALSAPHQGVGGLGSLKEQLFSNMLSLKYQIVSRQADS